MTLLDARPGLALLCHDVFRPAGFDLRFVGGFVRSHILGREPKDVDLCTDAEPDQQVALYDRAGVRYVATGLQHGTLTVILPGEDTYEITSLRVDEVTDGRRALVRYGVDWLDDLARRDLTYNAMAMTFEGEIIDPHGGRDDLMAGRTRFVGSPEARMREDYLRILRWLRFHATITPDHPLDEAAMTAARICGEGLGGISSERIWSEVSRLILAPAGPAMIARMADLGLSTPMRLPEGSQEALEAAHGALAWIAGEGLPAAPHAPAGLFSAFLRGSGVEAVEALARTWRWSAAERQEAVFLARHLTDPEADLRWLCAVDRNDPARVVRLAAFQDRRDDARAIAGWSVPVRPFKGQTLLDAGFSPGRHLSGLLDRLTRAWADSGYTATYEDLAPLIRTGA